MEIDVLYQLYLKYPSVQTDTRKLKPGDLYFALKGEHFNGNQFAVEALEKGAVAAIVDQEVGPENQSIIRVENVLETLQQLAKFHRLQLNIPFLAITGSNGKTTTKELVHAVLSSHYKTSTTEGNLNNHIGIPLTILKIPLNTEIAVIEMGANHQKEIASYCAYTLPNFGLINNVGKAHLEGFGGIEGVKKGKGELYDYIRSNGGTIFINTDFEYLADMSKGISHKVTYGAVNASTTGTIKQSDPFLKVEIASNAEPSLLQTQLVGDYNLPNVLAAVCIGRYFKVPFEKIKSAIENYTPSNSRSQLIERDGNKIILDAYNANPSSMKAAIENFAKMKGGNKIVILGAMAELGSESETEHQSIISLLEKYEWENVVLVGVNFLKISPPFQVFENATDAGKWFKNQGFVNKQVLIKGSRSMKMENILE